MSGFFRMYLNKGVHRSRLDTVRAVGLLQDGQPASTRDEAARSVSFADGARAVADAQEFRVEGVSADALWSAVSRPMFSPSANFLDESISCASAQLWVARRWSCGTCTSKHASRRPRIESQSPMLGIARLKGVRLFGASLNLRLSDKRTI